MGGNLVIGIIGSLIAAGIVWLITIFVRKGVLKRRNLREKNEIFNKLGRTFYEEGLTRFHFTRDDYGRTLATFLDGANASIEIVSISLKNTQEEGRLTDIFRKKLAQNPSFKICVSLINPNNIELVKVAADTLHMEFKELENEIVKMLQELFTCKDLLTSQEKSRFSILVHDCFPMGSAIMLDTTPKGGMIQVETKLHKAVRSESFGFQLTKESPFFKRNYIAWSRTLQDSKPINKQDIIR